MAVSTLAPGRKTRLWGVHVARAREEHASPRKPPKQTERRYTVDEIKRKNTAFRAARPGYAKNYYVQNRERVLAAHKERNERNRLKYRQARIRRLYGMTPKAFDAIA